jgi:hypothetical protein
MQMAEERNASLTVGTPRIDALPPADRAISVLHVGQRGSGSTTSGPPMTLVRSPLKEA